MASPDPHGNAHIPNHLVLGIVTTLFCCLPLGVVSIVHAAQVDSKRAAGDIAGARATSDKARFWATWSAAAVPILMILSVLIVGGVALVDSIVGG